MSLTTRCPACGTLFRVVPDQLRISEGWVRCGRCATVFDAHAQMPAGMQAPVAPGDAAPALATPAPAPAIAATTPSPVTTVPAAAVPEAMAVVWENSLPASAAVPLVAEDAAGAAPGGSDAPVAPALALEALLHDELAADAEMARASFDAAADTGDDSLQDAADKPGFVRDATRKAFWRKPWVRLLLLLGCGGLLGLLGLQALVQERDRLAAWLPSLEPLLQSVCSVAQCDIRPLRQIGAITVDSSAFGKLRPEAYRLNFVLKNSAAYAVATPAIELTLTDTREQVVVRKVFLPAEFGALRPALASGADLPGELVFATGPGIDAAAVAGYRVLAFYP